MAFSVVGGTFGSYLESTVYTAGVPNFLKVGFTPFPFQERPTLTPLPSKRCKEDSCFSGARCHAQAVCRLCPAAGLAEAAGAPPSASGSRTQHPTELCAPQCAPAPPLHSLCVPLARGVRPERPERARNVQLDGSDEMRTQRGRGILGLGTLTHSQHKFTVKCFCVLCHLSLGRFPQGRSTFGQREEGVRISFGRSVPLSSLSSSLPS